MDAFNEEKTSQVSHRIGIPIQSDSLKVIDFKQADVKSIQQWLTKDKIILLKSVVPAAADECLFNLASCLGLKTQLELQAGFAAMRGHRNKIGHYFMSVNNRDAYEFIPPHSEGTHAINMQLAAFYCYENTTDGGETVLFKVDQDSPAWPQLQDVGMKVKLSRPLTQSEMLQAKMVFKLNLPEDIVTEKDKIVGQKALPLPGVELFEVLKPLKSSYSSILGQNMQVYWDSVASHDHDQAAFFFDFLMAEGLLKQPENKMTLAEFDNANDRRVWSSCADIKRLFKEKYIYKLTEGDLLLFNNMSWTHGTNNWTPQSGKRHVAAAFA